MTGVVCVLVAALALAAGIAVGRRWGRSRGAVPPTAAPSAPALGDLLQRVFSATDEGLVVVDRGGAAVLANARAARAGRRRRRQARRPGGRGLRGGAASAARRSPSTCRRSTSAAADPPPCSRRCEPLGDGYTMVEAADTSDAVRLEATRRDFVANVSHELKTPVGAIGLLAEAVLDAADDPAEVRRFGTKIVSEAHRLGNLVTELIALSRLTAPKRLPGAVARRHRRGRRTRRCAAPGSRRRPRGIEIVVDEPSGLEVDGDQTLLVTALSNLLENAIAYSPAETPVSVSRRQAGDGVEIAGDRPRHRHRPRAPAAGLRALLPGRPGPLPGDRRHRAGAGDRQARAGQPRRRGAAVEQPGHRFDVHDARCPRARPSSRGPALRPVRSRLHGGTT